MINKLITGIIITIMATNLNANNKVETTTAAPEQTTIVEEVKEIELQKKSDLNINKYLPKSEIERAEELEITYLKDDRQIETEYQAYGFEKEEGYDTVGFYSYWDMKIVVEENEWTEDTLIHELAHFVDVTEDEKGMNKVYKHSGSKEFKEIYESEKNIIFNNEMDEYYRSCSSEYFAQAYTLFFNNQLDTSSKTFDYIQKVVKDLK